QSRVLGPGIWQRLPVVEFYAEALQCGGGPAELMPGGQRTSSPSARAIGAPSSAPALPARLGRSGRVGIASGSRRLRGGARVAVCWSQGYAAWLGGSHHAADRDGQPKPVVAPTSYVGWWHIPWSLRFNYLRLARSGDPPTPGRTGRVNVNVDP